MFWIVKLSQEDLRSYALRDWQAPERLARRLRAAQSIGSKVALGVEFYEATRRLRPDWPDERSRKRDLEAHIRLRDRLRRAAHVGIG